MRLLFTLSALLLFFSSLVAQAFTASDSIKGGLTPERSWWDLNYYDLTVEVDPEQRSIRGKNLIKFTALTKGSRLQIDLQSPMKILDATFAGQTLSLSHNGDAHYIDMPYELNKGESAAIVVTFSGQPRVALQAPWDGGFVWTSDNNKNPWIANANQGIGASVWWPVKEHPADEVDSMRMHITVPEGLVDVSNGQLTDAKTADGKTTYNWEIKNPINNYGVNISVGDYVSWEEIYPGEAGLLKMSYYVLRDNESKAREQFKDAQRMMEAFEYWLGPYPFYEDGFKLIEVPYLGMEHQSAVTYGNKYTNGYLGRDLSRSGEGLKFDYIIIHEAGHEWFANNITHADVADLWIHEAFTSYCESLFLDYHYGKESASKYIIGTRAMIRNDRPIQSPYRGVAHEGSGDMYYKGANIIHTLRTVVNDDEKWRMLLRDLNKEFRHQTVSSQEIFDYFNERLATEHFAPLPFFETYVQTTKVPVFSYKIKKGKLTYQWQNVVEGFKMPLDVQIGNKTVRLNTTEKPQTMKIKKSIKTINHSPDFYIKP